MSESIIELSSDDLDVVGAGTYFTLLDASTNIAFSKIKQTNVSKVYASSHVTVQQSNNVGTTIIIGGAPA